MDEAMATGAVVVGRRTFELAEGWGGDHHDGVPIFVLTHDVPDDPPPGSVRYATDVHECAAQARAAR
jgi:dihydrofolate reductase